MRDIQISKFILSLLTIALACVQADSQEAVVVLDRTEIDQRFREQLESVADICEQNGLTAEAQVTRNWFVERYPDREYFFVPLPADTLKPQPDADKLIQFWYRKFTQVRYDHAEQLFGLAVQMAESEENARAFQLLHEVLHENPDHAVARRALGYKQDSQGNWFRNRAVARASNPARPQRQFRWGAGTYSRITSKHFRIDCAGDKERGIELANRAERWYEIWGQMFFDYWSRGHSVKNWIDGKSNYKGSSHEFQMVLFRDRDQYLSDLASVQGIEISSGYYSNGEEMSLFYLADDSLATWRHELTHQWFQETIPTVDVPSESNHAWMVEGIAMLMESMKETEHYATVGGMDAVRLQYARLRFNREGYIESLSRLQTLSRSSLQTDSDVRKIYSQSAALCQFFMGDKYRNQFVEFIKTVYTRGGHKADLDGVGKISELDREFRDWLLPVPTETLKLIDQSRTLLSIPKSGVGAEVIEAISHCETVEWLELSNNPINDEIFSNIGELPGITRLYLDSTRIGDESATAIGKLKGLVELDLAATEISDAGIEHLSGLENLQALWLAKTSITDASIPALSNLTSLQIIDLRETGITEDGVAQLKQVIPDLRVELSNQ